MARQQGKKLSRMLKAMQVLGLCSLHETRADDGAQVFVVIQRTAIDDGHGLVCVPLMETVLQCVMIPLGGTSCALGKLGGVGTGIAFNDP